MVSLTAPLYICAFGTQYQLIYEVIDVGLVPFPYTIFWCQQFTEFKFMWI
jgi:hypothetical protein